MTDFLNTIYLALGAGTATMAVALLISWVVVRGKSRAQVYSRWSDIRLIRRSGCRLSAGADFCLSQAAIPLFGYLRLDVDDHLGFDDGISGFCDAHDERWSHADSQRIGGSRGGQRRWPFNNPMENHDSIADSLAGSGMDMGSRPLAQSVFTPTCVRNKEKRSSFCVDMDSLAERTYSHGRRVRGYLDYDNGLIGDRSAAGHCARLVGKQVEVYSAAVF